MNSKIYGDMSAIRANLADYLRQGYFWPVSEKEFEDFSKFMHDEYINLAKKEKNPELRDIAKVEFSFVKQLLQIFHYNYVKKYSQANKLELISGSDSEKLMNPDWSMIKLYYSSLEPQHNKFVRVIRRVFRNIVFNKHLPLSRLVNGLLIGANFTSVGSNDKIKREFIKKKKVFYNHVDWPDLLDNEIDLANIPNDFQEIFLSNIISPYLDKLSKTNSFFVKDIDLSKIADVWSKRSFEAFILYKRFQSSISSSELLITEISSPIAKLITVAYQRSKCKVFCFHHGNDAVATIQKQTFSSNISQCDNFIAPTKGIANRYKKHYSNVDCISSSQTKFLSINSSRMYDLYLKNTSKIIDKDVETVMLIGYPFNTKRYIGGRGLFFYQQVELEYRLISLLKSKNKRVIYKAHPERLKEIKGVFNNIVDEINVEPFERVWSKADLLIFTYSSTTTFGYALTTNVPIVLLDSDHEMRDPDDMLLLDKRINRVLTDISNDTKINFNSESFLSAIKSPISNISYEYVQNIYETL
jgi:hypothetical protein